MTILLFDTSTEILAVGAAEIQQGKIIRLERRETKTGLNHTGFLLPAVKELITDFSLKDGKPDGVACALGPGSFTGLRIGLSTAKGLAEGWTRPLVGVNNLKAMAQSALAAGPEGTTFLPAIDARKKKFYIALYKSNDGKAQEIRPPADLTPGQIAELLGSYPGTRLCGYQAALLQEQLQTLGVMIPTAETGSWMEALAIEAEEKLLHQDFLSENAGPFYLRLSEAEENLARTPPDLSR